jgi:hypothetical protein
VPWSAKRLQATAESVAVVAVHRQPVHGHLQQPDRVVHVRRHLHRPPPTSLNGHHNHYQCSNRRLYVSLWRTAGTVRRLRGYGGGGDATAWPLQAEAARDGPPERPVRDGAGVRGPSWSDSVGALWAAHHPEAIPRRRRE